MTESVDSIGTNSNTVVVMALVSGPVVYQSLVRIKDRIFQKCFLFFLIN
jgi:hypothetical protein